MTFFTNALAKRSVSHFICCRSERLSLVDIEEEEVRPPLTNFCGIGNNPVSHGSFERLLDNIFDVLEEAESSHLINEKATVYLKNFLKVKLTPSLETTFSIAAGDVRHQASYVTNE
jgi:hypothetical protein